VRDVAPSIPAIVRHHAAILAAWSHATPEISVQGSRAELRLSLGPRTFVAVFGRRKRNWSARGIEIRSGEHTAAFARGELARALAVLLGHEPMAPPPAARPPSPRPSATIRERRTTVMRV
jgi:hypothetical protein